MNIKNLQPFLTKNPSLPIHFPTGTPKELALFLAIPEDFAAVIRKKTFNSGALSNYIDCYVSVLEEFNVQDPEKASTDIYLNGLLLGMLYNTLAPDGVFTEVLSENLLHRYLNGAGKHHCLPKSKTALLPPDDL